MPKQSVHGRSRLLSVRGVALLVVAMSLSSAAINSARGASLTPIATSGYSSDLVAEVGAASSSSGTTTSIGGPWVFYETGAGTTSVPGLPVSGSFTSTYNANTTFQFQPYDGSNTPDVPSDNILPMSGTLTLNTPAAYSELAFLTVNVDGSSYTATLNFSNAASLTTPSYSDPDWTNSDANNALGVGLSARGGALETDYHTAYLREWDYTLPSGYSNALLTSIDFSGANEFVFAVSGAAPVPEPASLVLCALGAVGLLSAVRRRRQGSVDCKPCSNSKSIH